MPGRSCCNLWFQRTKYNRKTHRNQQRYVSFMGGKTDSKLKNNLPQTATVSFSRLLYESVGTWFSVQRQSGTELVSVLNPRSCFLGHW